MSITNNNTALEKRAHISHSVSLLLYTVLLVTQLYRTVWLSPPSGPIVLIALLVTLPLLLPLPGLLRKRTRSAVWLCFMLSFYFTNGVLAVWTRPDEISEWLVMLASFWLFISAVLFARWQARLNIADSQQLD